MGILKGIFQKEDNKGDKGFVWKHLESLEQLAAIKNQKGRVSVLFKHSTRCIVSKTVLKEVEEKFKELNELVDFYFLDLLNYRELSAAIAENFDVIHESPQLLVIDEGAARTHASHYDIVSLDLRTILTELES